MRDPHDPVIPGQHEHPEQGHGGVSMPIGVSGDLEEAHDPVEVGAPAQDTVARVKSNPEALVPAPMIPEGMMLIPIPIAVASQENDVAHHIKDAAISSLRARLVEAEAKIAELVKERVEKAALDHPKNFLDITDALKPGTCVDQKAADEAQIAENEAQS